jgi:predicted metal-dependent hydrolase
MTPPAPSLPPAGGARGQASGQGRGSATGDDHSDALFGPELFTVDREPVDESVPAAIDPVVEPAIQAAAPKVVVKRSKRRRRTVSAYRDGDTTVVLMPASISRADEAQWVDEMLQRLDRSEARRRPSDDELLARAQRLAKQYLPRDVSPRSVRWVTNQQQRWGSCTPADGTIRLSHRLKGMPEYVIDYVLVHELVHLLVPDHGPRFVALMDAYPMAERARGYLEGWTSAPAQRESSPSESPSSSDGCSSDT